MVRQQKEILFFFVKKINKKQQDINDKRITKKR